MSNLSPDWRYGYDTCERCGERYHASGTVMCACSICESPECEAIVIHTTHCDECEEQTQ